MKTVLPELSSDKKVQSDDMSYFWLISFFTEFQRLTWKYKDMSGNALVPFGSKIPLNETHVSDATNPSDKPNHHSSANVDKNMQEMAIAQPSKEAAEADKENQNVGIGSFDISELFPPDDPMDVQDKKDEEEKKEDNSIKEGEEEKRTEDNSEGKKKDAMEIHGEGEEEQKKKEGEGEELVVHNNKKKSDLKDDSRYEMVSVVGTTLDFESFARLSKHLKLAIEDKKWEALPNPIAALKEMVCVFLFLKQLFPYIGTNSLSFL